MRSLAVGVLVVFVGACGGAPTPAPAPPTVATTTSAPPPTAPMPETEAPAPTPAPAPVPAAPAPGASLVLSGNMDAQAVDMLALQPRERRVRVTMTSLKTGGATEALEVTMTGGLYEIRIERDNATAHTAETETVALDVKQAKPILDRIDALLNMPAPTTDQTVNDGAHHALVVERKQEDGKMRVHALSWSNAKDVAPIFWEARKELAVLAAKEGKRVKLGLLLPK